tara:strand:+ start:202 stop:345 length:144 start_codon:yes stop_codon:yes gene_type:complete
MKRIVHWTIKVTWSDGEEEFLNDIPRNDGIENYLDKLEEEREEEEND